MASSSFEIKSENISDVKDTEKRSYQMGIKFELEEGTLHTSLENVDTQITLDYKNSEICHSNSQSSRTNNSRAGIESKNTLDIKEAEEPFCTMRIITNWEDNVFDPLSEDADTETSLNRDGTNIKCETYLFGTEGQVSDMCDEYAPAIQMSSVLANATNLNFVTSSLPHERKKIVETTFESIDDFHQSEKTQYVQSIKTECEEDNFHVSSECTDTNILFGRDEANLKCDAFELEHDVKCKIEETQILFGSEFTPTDQRSSEFTNGKDLEFVALSSQHLTKIERSDRTLPNRLNDTEKSVLEEHLIDDENINQKVAKSKEIAKTTVQPFKCPNCTKRFKFNYSLKRHQMSRHSEEFQPHNCSDCGQEFTTKYQLKIHRMSQHLNIKPHKCPDCDKRFTVKQSLDRHQIYQHSKRRPHGCPECDKRFAEKAELNRHRVSRHSKFKPHKCPDCKKTFNTNHMLDEHRMSQHSKLKPHKCPDCGESFVRISSLEQHQMSHHSKDKPHKCSDCDESFVRISSLEQHQISHNSKHKPNKCPDCDMSFLRKIYLNYHQMTRHSKPKPHKCPDCDQSFIIKSFLNKHQMLKHSKPKPYKCPDCDESFVAKHVLDKHAMSRHSRLKPFECPDCEKSFNRKCILDLHQMSRHSKPKPHKCPECGTSCATKYILNRHQMLKHSKPKPHKCPDCDESFTAKWILDRHQMSRHSKSKPHNGANLDGELLPVCPDR